MENVNAKGSTLIVFEHPNTRAPAQVAAEVAACLIHADFPMRVSGLAGPPPGSTENLVVKGTDGVAMAESVQMMMLVTMAYTMPTAGITFAAWPSGDAGGYRAVCLVSQPSPTAFPDKTMLLSAMVKCAADQARQLANSAGVNYCDLLQMISNLPDNDKEAKQAITAFFSSRKK